MSVDYSPLYLPIGRDDVTRFKRESRDRGAPWAQSTNTAVLIAVLFCAVGFIAVIAIFASFLPVVLGSFGSAGVDLGPLPLAFPLILLTILGIGGLILYRTIFGSVGRWESLLRRTRFASVNGLVFVPTVKNPDYPGIIFSLGDSRKSFDCYRSTVDPQLDLGNFSYMTGSGRERTTHTWGYLALRLERKLPHMLLDARGNNGLLGTSNLPAMFRRDQRLSLEGDFDKFFTLYCPTEYERDALYVFTPDLMALLIDEVAAFDVEIVDDWMLVYSSRALALDNAATVNRLFRIVETVGAKTLSQTDRYADERIGDRSVNLVAPHGQRLKRSFAFAGIGVVAVGAWLAISFARMWF